MFWSCLDLFLAVEPLCEGRLCWWFVAHCLRSGLTRTGVCGSCQVFWEVLHLTSYGLLGFFLSFLPKRRAVRGCVRFIVLEFKPGFVFEFGLGTGYWVLLTLAAHTLAQRWLAGAVCRFVCAHTAR